MSTYFTIGDFILILPMALAGALFLGAIPASSTFKHNVWRVLGALLGAVFAVVLVEGLPAVM
jgi:positive regulator of sigma E activity